MIEAVNAAKTTKDRAIENQKMKPTQGQVSLILFNKEYK
jgi:hypothetical protein